jgi:hypothetical protein
MDPNGNPTNPVVNQLVNFGWEYVWHCHILSHEEMDMMRPQSLALPPNVPANPSIVKSGSAWQATFTDNSIAETAYQLQRTADSRTWQSVAAQASPLDQPNTTGALVTLKDTTANGQLIYGYRVAALNTVGYGAEFPSMTVQSVTGTTYTTAGAAVPTAPTGLSVSLLTNPLRASLSWTDNATNENGFAIERAPVVGGVPGTFVQIASVGARNNTGGVTATDSTVQAGQTYAYRVLAFNGVGVSLSNEVTFTAPTVPVVPTGVTAANGTAGGRVTAGLNWTNVTGATSYSIRWSTSPGMAPATQVNNVTSGQQINMPNSVKANQTVYMQVRANNAVGSSLWAPTIAPIAVIAR